MEFTSYVGAGAGDSSSSSSSKGKKSKPLVEEDLLSRVGMAADGVDCTLKLAIPGAVTVAAPPPPPELDVNNNAMQRRDRARRPGYCTMCAATETPLWRYGPHGPKSLCNACGIRYKKEEKQSRLTLDILASHSKAKAHKDQHLHKN